MKLKLPRRRWLLLIACLAAVAIAVIGWPRTSGRFTREQYERVRIGMSLAEVEQTLGVPPGYYGLPTEPWDRLELAESESPAVYRDAKTDPSSRFYIWEDDGGQIVVWIAADKKVVSKSHGVRVHPIKAMAQASLAWLRGLVLR
jgi:hypothetical protein